MNNIDFYLALVIIIACSLIYYGYVNKRRYQLKEKEIELEHKKIELEIRKVEKGYFNDNKIK